MSKYDYLLTLEVHDMITKTIEAHRESVRELRCRYHNIYNYHPSGCRQELIFLLRQEIHRHVITIRVLERIKL